MTEIQLVFATITVIVVVTGALAGMLRWHNAATQALLVEKINNVRSDVHEVKKETASIRKGVDRINGSVIDHEKRIWKLEQS